MDGLAPRGSTITCGSNPEITCGSKIHQTITVSVIWGGVHKKHCTLIACHLRHYTVDIAFGGGKHGETITSMFLCTQKHCILIACYLKHCTLNKVMGGGWTITFMFFCTHKR